MFKEQIKIYGRHAEILKKYSKDKQGEVQYNFYVTSTNGNKRNIYIFETMIQAYMVAAMIGIIRNKSVPVEMKTIKEENKGLTANIMADAVYSRFDLLKRISELMILSDESGNLSLDGKIKRAFTINDEVSNEVEKEIGGYVRGGLEIIDEYFKTCITYEDVVTGLLSLIQDFDFLSGE